MVCITILIKALRIFQCNELFNNLSRLLGIGEVVTGMKLETFDDTVNALRKIAGI